MERISTTTIQEGFRLACEMMRRAGFCVSASSFAEYSAVYVFSVETHGPATYGACRHSIDVLIHPSVDVPFTSIQDTEFSV